MDSIDSSDETSSMKCSHSPEPTLEKDPSSKLITGFIWLLILFTATSYISQCIIFQALENFSKDIRNMEDICDRHSRSFNDDKCECIFNYLEGLDHPQFQYYFHKLKLPPPDNSKTGQRDWDREKAWYPKGDFDPENAYIDPKAYVVGCGNSSPERRIANEDVCESLEKLITTDLFTKWWYDADASCYNSILNTIKRVHPGLVAVLVLVLFGIILTPVHLLQSFQVI